MSKAILGRKLGMTQIFTEEGKVVPVTVVESGNNIVIQNKTVENDGYNAVQLGFGEVKEHKVNKPMKGHFDKAGVKPVKFIREMRLQDASEYKVGDSIGVDIFSEMISGPGGRVLKGKKLPGRMGGERVTVQRLTVVRVDADRNLILIKGAIPGPKKSFVVIKNTVKPGKN